MNEDQNEQDYSIKIKILGVGGGGSNTIDFISESNAKGVETCAVNTDAQALEVSKAGKHIRIGEQLTSGLGAGSNPKTGFGAAEESSQAIKDFIKDADIVFIAAGMGGGTGTGAAPYIAKLSKEIEALTISIVTKPFTFEGGSRMEKAIDGIKKLNDISDINIVIPNQKIVDDHKKEFIENAFMIPDAVLKTAVESLIRMLYSQSQTSSSIDLNTLKGKLKNKGLAVMGIGESRNKDLSGEENLRIALDEATSSKILEHTIEGASSFLVLLSANYEKLTVRENKVIQEYITSKVTSVNNIIISHSGEVDWGETDRAITIVATDYPEGTSEKLIERER